MPRQKGYGFMVLLASGVIIIILAVTIWLSVSNSRKAAISPTKESPASITEDDISLWWSFIGRHDIGDRYYLHVVFLLKDTQFMPETVEVIDPTTNQVAGPFTLNNRPDSNVCPALDERGEVYWTEGIDASNLPPLFQDFITYDPRIFRVTFLDTSGNQQVIDLKDIPGVCASLSE